MKINLKCTCGHRWTYKTRNPNKIPMHPHTRCSKCNRNISIKRSKLIGKTNFIKLGTRKHLRKNSAYPKLLKNLEILKLLDQGFYAEEICQKIGVSKGNLSGIIKSFKSRNLIEQIQSYPKRYKLSAMGTLILTQGDLSQKRIQEFTTDKRKSPKSIESVRIHKIRFKNKLIQKPSWLNKITNQSSIFGLTIKRIKLNNWDKFLLFFNYQDFKGLEKIEVCNDTIIYNFNRNIEEQYVSSNKELEDYFKEIIFNCKQARSFLQQKGFGIDNKDPEFCQKPSFAIQSNGDPNALGTLGKKLIMTITSPGEIKEVDDSPKLMKGEEETDDIEKVKSYFDMPKEIANINSKMEQMNTNILNMSNAMSKMAEGMETMAKAITQLVGVSKQENDSKPAPGGLYQ